MTCDIVTKMITHDLSLQRYDALEETSAKGVAVFRPVVKFGTQTVRATEQEAKIEEVEAGVLAIEADPELAALDKQYVGQRLRDGGMDFEVVHIHTKLDKKKGKRKRGEEHQSFVATCVILEDGEVPEDAITELGSVHRDYEETFGINSDDPNYVGYEGLDLMIQAYKEHHGESESE